MQLLFLHFSRVQLGNVACVAELHQRVPWCLTPHIGCNYADAQLWVDKHAPKTAEDLAVHKAKVTEVKGWLEGYLAYRKNAPSRVLLITGMWHVPCHQRVLHFVLNSASRARTIKIESAAVVVRHQQHSTVATCWNDASPNITTPHQPCMCYLVAHAGPAGCGKSSTVRALAADLCFDLVEWTPPVPVLWSEHQYQVGG